MSLLNYTTKVSVDRSVQEVMKMLSVHGASAIMVENDDTGTIAALSFKMNTGERVISFKLPIQWEPILEIIRKDKRVPNNKKNKEHAKCVAWRIMKDWIEAQMAIIETNMVTTDQVFLPYAIAKDGRTLYETVKSQNLLGSPSQP